MKDKWKDPVPLDRNLHIHPHLQPTVTQLHEELGLDDTEDVETMLKALEEAGFIELKITDEKFLVLPTDKLLKRFNQ